MVNLIKQPNFLYIDNTHVHVIEDVYEDILLFLFKIRKYLKERISPQKWILYRQLFFQTNGFLLRYL